MKRFTQISKTGMPVYDKGLSKKYPHIYMKRHKVFVGEINIEAVYNGSNLILNPNHQNIEEYKDTYVKDYFDIEVNTWRFDRNHLPLVRYRGNEIEKLAENYMDAEGYCGLGIFNVSEIQSELRTPYGFCICTFLDKYVVPFFVWQAYKKKHNKIPPWGKYSDKEALEALYKKYS